MDKSQENFIPKRLLGKTGQTVSILGLGGEGLLRTYGKAKEATSLIHRAIDLGMTYFESAHAYAGSESYYGMALGERRREIFLASKSHERTLDRALNHLETTLKNMKTDFLDLWMVHDVRTIKDIDQIFGPQGAIKAFESARRDRLVKWIGISGHRNPTILSRAIDLFPFDTILIPINAAEPHYWPFVEEVLSKAQAKGIGILGMKSLSRGVSIEIFGPDASESFLRFALSQPVACIVIGCDSIEQLEINAKVAQTFRPMTQRDQNILLEKTRPYARELMYYKL
ncbi:MAG: aldo/keto reductase [Thermodesulfobacteriota bacterium]